MRRRDFIKTASIGIVGFAMPKLSIANPSSNNSNIKKDKNITKKTAQVSPIYTLKNTSAKWKTVEITTHIETSNESPTQIWLPMPMSQTTYQELISTEWVGNFSKASIAKDKKYSAQLFYANWEKADKIEMSVTHQVRIKNRLEIEPSDDEQNKIYLEPTSHIPIDGIVKETAQKIVKSETNADKKAKLIYDWMVENTFRDPKVRGCGLGDVKSLLISGNFGGKCADLSSLFVGLCRASGVPAREVFGIRVLPSEFYKSIGKLGDVTKGQHCRAEYFSMDNGWVPVDPADVRKVILEENLDIKNEQVKNIREKFFGFWEMNWVAYNTARDYSFLPKYAENINYMMYPRLYSEKTIKDGMDPEQFKYTITAKEIS